MPKNRLSDLRDHLFETLEALKDEKEPMDVKRANAVANVANSIIESAKLELKFIDMTGEGLENGFLNAKQIGNGNGNGKNGGAHS